MSCDVGEVTERSENQLFPTSQALHLRPQQSSFSNLSVTSPTSELILQPFRCFTYVTAHYPTLLSLSLRHRLLLMSSAELILQFFRHFTYVTAHSSILPSRYPRHSSFSNPSVASPTSQLILQSLFRFSYVTGSSHTSPGEPPMIYLPPQIDKFSSTAYYVASNTSSHSVFRGK